MIWNTDPDSHRSVRSPAFFGPVILAAALLFVSCLSDPLWRQFHLVEARALNTTMTVGEWGACVQKNGNLTGQTGPSVICSSAVSGFDLYVNLNDSIFYNFPTVKDNGLILGTTQPSGTIEHVQIISGSRMGIVWLHVLTALAAVLVVVSLAIPPKWIQGGKSGLANFQRSGILTLIFAGISMIMCFVTFGTYYGLVQTLKKNFNAVPGISANWSGSCIMWYVLPCGILYIPAFLTVLLPTYVRPVEEDDDESAPMAPLASPHMPQSNSMNKSVESFGSGARTPVGANSPFPKVPAMYTGK